MAPDDPASATLAAIRADLRAAELAGLLDADPAGDYFPAALARHSSVLLAAVEAVLKAADKWDVTADRLGTHHSRHRAFKMCAAKIREAITAALSGEEAQGG